MTDNFYRPQDEPSGAQRERIWRAVRAQTAPRRLLFGFIPDARSFTYGVAAAAVIYFMAVGVGATVRSFSGGALPEAVRLDDAYRSAIRELERVAPRVVTETGRAGAGAAASRLEELKRIDAAIADLQAITGGSDLSPLTQKRLRQLYGLKLQALQDMIEQQEVEL
jgi:hypothetical protein